MSDLEFFNKNGYLIKKNFIERQIHEELFYVFYDLACNIINNNNINFTNKIKPISKVSFPNDLNQLDMLLINVLSLDKKFIGEIYDTVSYTSSFLKLVSSNKIEEVTKKILSLKNYNSIYSWKHRVRIDPPNDNRRTYGWHQEIFYTIPEVKFVQTWCPLIRHSTTENGTIQICPKSHNEGIAKQSWNEIDGRATQILVDDEIVKKYEQLNLPMNLGDILFFDPHLFHRSGTNVSQEVRFSLVGMWNDCTHEKFKAPLPNFIPRTITEKEYFKKIMQKKSN